MAERMTRASMLCGQRRGEQHEQSIVCRRVLGRHKKFGTLEESREYDCVHPSEHPLLTPKAEIARPMREMFIVGTSWIVPRASRSKSRKPDSLFHRVSLIFPAPLRLSERDFCLISAQRERNIARMGGAGRLGGRDMEVASWKS